MKINVDVLAKIQGQLAPICRALRDGWTILELCPVEGWVEVFQINPNLGAEDYRINYVQRTVSRAKDGQFADFSDESCFTTVLDILK